MAANEMALQLLIILMVMRHEQPQKRSYAANPQVEWTLSLKMSKCCCLDWITVLLCSLLPRDYHYIRLKLWLIFNNPHYETL